MEAPTQSDDRAGALPVLVVCGLAFEAAIAAAPGVVTLCATGRAGLEKLHGLPACRAVISFGTGGALDPALRPGACVLADGIVTPTQRYPVDFRWLRALRSRLPQALEGTLAGVDEPLSDAADKMQLRRSSGACMADMESHWAALIAQQRGLPFAACRVVVDPAQRSLPSSAMAGLCSDGTTAVMPLLRALARHPGELPALLQLACDALVAKRSLRVIRSQTGPAFAADDQ